MDRKRSTRRAAERNPETAGQWQAGDGADRRTDLRREPLRPSANEPVRLVDLSANGCCLGFATSVGLRPGQFIHLGFAGENGAIRAIVRWVIGLRIGAEFTRSLPYDRIEAILSEDRNPMVGLL